MNFSCFKTLKENEEEAIDLEIHTKLDQQLTNQRLHICRQGISWLSPTSFACFTGTRAASADALTPTQ